MRYRGKELVIEGLIQKFEKGMKNAHLKGPFVPYGMDNGVPLYNPDPVKNDQILKKLGLKK